VVFLVPRQLRMTGMTGNVPYYGGRLTPRQAYAASHPRKPTPPSPPPPAHASTPASAPVGPVRERDPQATLGALENLFEAGVLSRDEYDDLRARVHP
jgi:hypothetical protein